MQILGSLGSNSQASWGQGTTLSPLLTPPPPPPPVLTTTTSTISPLGFGHNIHSTISDDSTVSPTLVRLCSLWPYIHSKPVPSPPEICQRVPTTLFIDHRDIFQDSGEYRVGHFKNGVTGPGERMVGIDQLNQELTFSGRSFSLMGVLGGVLFILLVIAFITCIRHRKRVRTEADGELDLDVISSRIRRIHQARAGHHLLSVLGSLPETPPVPPPSYDTVLKQREKEELDLPSYLEAIRESEELHHATCYPDITTSSSTSCSQQQATSCSHNSTPSASRSVLAVSADLPTYNTQTADLPTYSAQAADLPAYDAQLADVHVHGGKPEEQGHGEDDEMIQKGKDINSSKA